MTETYDHRMALAAAFGGRHLSSFAKALRQKLPSLSSNPSHADIMELVASAAGFSNLAALRAVQAKAGFVGPAAGSARAAALRPRPETEHPLIGRFLHAALCHLAEEDIEILQNCTQAVHGGLVSMIHKSIDRPNIIAGQHGYGWFIRVSEDPETLEDDCAALTTAGASPSFIALMKYAGAKDLGLIYVHEDAPPGPDLPPTPSGGITWKVIRGTMIRFFQASVDDVRDDAGLSGPGWYWQSDEDDEGPIGPYHSIEQAIVGAKTAA